MNQVFHTAAFGKMFPINPSATGGSGSSSGSSSSGDASKPKPAYSIFSSAELNAKIVSFSILFFLFNNPPAHQTSLQSEIEALHENSAERRAGRIRAVQLQDAAAAAAATTTMGGVRPGEGIVV
jgi:hypothetical protein